MTHISKEWGSKKEVMWARIHNPFRNVDGARYINRIGGADEVMNTPH